MLTMKNANNVTCNYISSYAPTLETTMKKPDETTTFYDQLSSVIKLTSKRQALVIGGDFNAKTKTQVNDNNENIIGKYAKSPINKNGEILLQFCKLNNLKITNTCFKTQTKSSHHMGITCNRSK